MRATRDADFSMALSAIGSDWNGAKISHAHPLRSAKRPARLRLRRLLVVSLHLDGGEEVVGPIMETVVRPILPTPLRPAAIEQEPAIGECAPLFDSMRQVVPSGLLQRRRDEFAAGIRFC